MSTLRLIDTIGAPPARPGPVLSDQQWAFLNALRGVALQCRAQARIAWVPTDRPAPTCAQTATEILVHSLPQVLPQKPVIYRPGEMALSFDETWLAALAAAICGDDSHSAGFLLRSRVRAPAQGVIRHLVDLSARPHLSLE